MIKINGREVLFESFPNGETKLVHESILGNGNTLDLIVSKVTFKYENDSDLIKLMMVKRYLDAFPIITSSLLMYYLPYSRMDRSENNSAFTLKYVSDFINWLGFNKVEIIEPHSDVSCALINKSKAVSINDELLAKVVNEVNFNEEKDYIVFPDSSAFKRYGKIVGDLNKLICFKDRDFETGRIKSLDVLGTVHKGIGKKAILIDDLCSRGNTFLFTSEKLKELGFEEIYLIVSHCENSVFDGKILDGKLINKIFTTDSILSKTHSNIKIFKLDDLIGEKY